MLHTSARLGAGVALASLLAAVVSTVPDRDGGSQGAEASPASPVPPVIATTEQANAYPQALVAGRLTLVDGCLLIAGRPVWWPFGATWDTDARAVVFTAEPFADAPPAKVGERFRGGGGYYSATTDFSTFEDPQVGAAVAACLEATGAPEAVYAYPEE